MGKATKRKQEAEEARKPDYNGLLLQAKTTQAKKHAEIVSFDPMTVIRNFANDAIRPLDAFTPRTRSLNTSTRTRELIRYAFNKYNPPPFLYNAWDSEPKPLSNNFEYLFGVKEDWRKWYLALAQGKSLYKECSMGLLTKRETFYFSTCPFTFTIAQAVWFSVIRCLDETAPSSLARKIASTKLSNYRVDDFWKGVARWFIENDTSVRQMNDLLDYIHNRHAERPDWYIKDQTLTGLQKAMQSWHRELYRMRSMSVKYEKWEGISLPDSQIEQGAGRKKIHWRFHQIKTGKELAEEGNKQHHCVSSYGSRCASGACSIWSLTTDEPGAVVRALTIEVAGKDIVQARGYANRSPKNSELAALREWASKSGFRLARM